eukprot:Tamp_23116.p1 GENE.Tamp_23116~~Tamp_23116.p1  ORF type:complete len:235 (+),score=29.97 Tamp_23116:341-1045(+)
MAMAWVPKWRERVMMTENLERTQERAKGTSRIEELKRKQLKLTHKIQWHEEEYDRAVREASLRRAPTQNGSDRRRFTSNAQAEHKSELALRPPDRQIFSRMYSKVDRDCWRLDESRHWYCKNASDDVIPDMELESFGFTAVGKPGKTWRGTALAKQEFPALAPVPPQVRESRSAAQMRLTAHKPPPTPHHWSDHNNLLAMQSAKAKEHPLQGNINMCVFFSLPKPSILNLNPKP